uniref:Uncharacterized protein n=1 Tax=Sphaerodactylus townsendi TaxID=933632 RepID=A0ACB8F186_9SAUR
MKLTGGSSQAKHQSLDHPILNQDQSFQRHGSDFLPLGQLPPWTDAWIKVLYEGRTDNGHTLVVSWIQDFAPRSLRINAADRDLKAPGDPRAKGLGFEKKMCRNKRTPRHISPKQSCHHASRIRGKVRRVPQSQRAAVFVLGLHEKVVESVNEDVPPQSADSHDCSRSRIGLIYGKDTSTREN